MDGAIPPPDRASFGEISIEEAEDMRLRLTENAEEITVPRLKYIWHPPEALMPLLPPAFQLSMQCVTGRDGVRRFYPWDWFELFLALASEGGLAILTQRKNLNAEWRNSYRTMRLFLLRVRRSAEFLNRGFEHLADLRVVLSGRATPSERDVLPDDLGLDTQGSGDRWSVRDLIEHGKVAARAAGCSDITTRQCIHYGFIQAARLNPLHIAESKVPLLIRSALFSVDSSDEPDARLLEFVRDRLQTALHTHLGDSTAGFEKWYLGSKNSLVHQLAKQKGSPGGQLDESEVRKVLLHLGWKAYEYASSCVHAQMRIFQAALPHSLSDQERLLFENMHQPQPYLGGLPLVLLVPRFKFIRGILWDLWEHLPDTSRLPVFYRMLDYYGTLSTRRREADRRIKNGRQAEFNDEAYVPHVNSDTFQRIAAEILEMKGIDCGCPHREWYSELVGRPRDKIRILHCCAACAFQKETVLTREEFTRIGELIL
jgi:hypothetical protein